MDGSQEASSEIKPQTAITTNLAPQRVSHAQPLQPPTRDQQPPRREGHVAVTGPPQRRRSSTHTDPSARRQTDHRTRGQPADQRRQPRAPGPSRPACTTQAANNATQGEPANRGSLESEPDILDDTQSESIFWQLTNWRQKSKLILTLAICLLVLGIVLLILSSINHLRFHQGFDPGLALTLSGCLLVVIAAAIFVKAPLNWKAGTHAPPPDPAHQRPLVLSGSEKISPGAARVIYRKELEDEFVKIETDGAAGTGSHQRENTSTDIVLTENKRPGVEDKGHSQRKSSKTSVKIDKSIMFKESPRAPAGATPSPRPVNVPSYTQPVMPKYWSPLSWITITWIYQPVTQIIDHPVECNWVICSFRQNIILTLNIPVAASTADGLLPKNAEVAFNMNTFKWNLQQNTTISYNEMYMIFYNLNTLKSMLN